VRILQIWFVVFAFVGSQMAWSLRPFVGAPNLGFQIFRQQEGNFYQGVWLSVVGLSKGQSASEPKGQRTVAESVQIILEDGEKTAGEPKGQLTVAE